MAEAEGVGDGAWPGWVGMFGALGIEGGGDAPFDDPRVAAVPTWRQAQVSDLGEEVVQEAVDKKGVAVEEVRARWQRGIVRRRRWRVPVKLRRSGSRCSRAAASAIRQRMAR